VKAWIDHVFAINDFHRLTAKIDQRNIASANLAERVGMRKEGEYREDDFFKGEWTSTWQYALLRSELA
jgi:aminoglycoside 6'-N-acetyltransferase